MRFSFHLFFAFPAEIEEAIEKRELEPLKAVVKKVDDNNLRQRLKPEVERAEEVIEQLEVMRTLRSHSSH